MQDMLRDGPFMEDIHLMDLDLANMRDPNAQNYGPLSPQHQMQTPDDSSDGQTNQNENFMSGMGARPLPTSFDMQLAPNASSTLTDFTKRRKWSQRVIEELKDFLHTSLRLTASSYTSLLLPKLSPAMIHSSSLASSSPTSYTQMTVRYSCASSMSLSLQAIPFDSSTAFVRLTTPTPFSSPMGILISLPRPRPPVPAAAPTPVVASS